MVIVTLQRDKCIGCNYCAEFAPEFFRMSNGPDKLRSNNSSLEEDSKFFNLIISSNFNLYFSQNEYSLPVLPFSCQCRYSYYQNCVYN